MKKVSINTHRLIWLLFSVIVIGIAALYLYLAYKTTLYAGMTADGAIYLQMADYFSPFYSSSVGEHGFLLSHYPFPPLYPMFLGYVGGGSRSPEVSYLSSGIIMLAVLYVTYIWYRQLGLGRGISLASMLCFALMPVTLQHLLVIESEHLYLLLTLSGFVVLNRAVAGVARYSLPGVFFGLSSLTRTIGIIAIVAYALVVWRNHRMGRVIILLTVSILPLALWVGYKAVYFSHGGYLSSLYEGFRGDVVTNVLTQANVNLRLLWLYWVGCFDYQRMAYVGFFLWPVSLLIVGGLLMRLRKLEADAVYVAGYIVVILIWPYPAQMERFIYTILPFLLIYGVLTLCYIYSKLPGFLVGSRSVPVYAYMVLVAILVAPSLFSMWNNLYHPVAMKYTDLARTSSWLTASDVNKVKFSYEFMRRIYQSMEDVSGLVPAGECIISTEPAYLMLYSGRKSIKPKSQGVADEAFLESIRPCKYIFMMSVQSRPSMGNPPMYPFYRVKDDMQVLSVQYLSENSDDNRVASMLVRYPADQH